MNWDDKAFLAGCRGEVCASGLDPHDQAYLADLVRQIHAGKPGVVIVDQGQNLRFIGTNANRREIITMLQRAIAHQWEALIEEGKNG